MKKILILFFAAAAALCSCSTYQSTSRETGIRRQDIVVSPTVVDVKVDYTKRINETSKRCKTKAEAMDEARYLAITKNNIDVVVDLIYKIEKRSRKYQATITGFAGYYMNSRTFYEDVKLLHEVDKADVEKYLILHNPEVIKYMNQKGEVVNIYHNEK